jgi:hypothetical protein
MECPLISTQVFILVIHISYYIICNLTKANRLSIPTMIYFHIVQMYNACGLVIFLRELRTNQQGVILISY